ncbi:hypothetical protein HanOQP8_Chr13g0471631 [Helianthus annuus]|nr:hypothetical protein HanLR1_Chr13g0472681 [Helianthus annuus]KAJ0670210.1 hypothetical protein HanOQP8_Chr13g0471631 [Helianthus annuus]
MTFIMHLVQNFSSLQKPHGFKIILDHNIQAYIMLDKLSKHNFKCLHVIKQNRQNAEALFGVFGS